MTDLCFLSIPEILPLFRKSEVSPVEYVQALLDRIGALDGGINAVLHLTPELALDQARDAEREVQAGGWRGALHGIPFGLKDIIDVEGLPTTAHSKIFAGNVARADATAVVRLRAAGGVLMGKLATHEFAVAGPSFDLPWPPARNPWNREYYPGGSSSGSAAAVAAGFVPAALGTDTSGSVRGPASMCGIVGMKATYGLVSRVGVFPFSYALDHVGPLTRNVRDNAIVLNAIAGYDPRDPTSVRMPVADATAGIGLGVKGLKVGLIRHFYTRDVEADPEMVRSIDAAAEVLANEGAELSEIEVAPLAEYVACVEAICVVEGYAVHEKWLRERPGDYGQRARERLLGGAFLRAVDYVQALRLRQKLARDFAAAIEDLDVVVTASAMDPAVRLDDDAAIDFIMPRQARAPFNLTGSPALAMPSGFSEAGLPLSIQIVGKPFDEAMVYRVADAYERAAGWFEHHPAL